MLKDYDTCELVKELSTREGVTKIRIDVDGIVTIGVKHHGSDISTDNVSEGPVVILKIID